MRKRDLTWNGIQTRHRDRQLRDCTESKPTHLIRQSESIRIDSAVRIDFSQHY